VTTGFAAPVARLAYALAPWTPLLPFALTRRPTSKGGGASARFVLPLRGPLLLFVVVALAVDILFGGTALARASTVIACIGFAGCIGALLADFDDATMPSAAVAIGVFSLAAVIAHDLSLVPERAMLVGASAKTTARTAHLVRIALWVLASASTLALLADASWLRFGQRRIGRGMIIAVAGLAGAAAIRLHASFGGVR
jgi:hypothetical protein